MNRLFICAVIAVAAIAAQAAQAQVFKWVDEKGRTHYGEKPPEGVKANEVAKPTPPSDPSKAAAPDDWKRRALDARRDKAERDRGEQERETNERAQRERRCRNARVALDRLENVQGLYRYNERGERVYFTDAEREPEKARAQREIREHCAG
jgi:hypothetical protein